MVDGAVDVNDALLDVPPAVTVTLREIFPPIVSVIVTFAVPAARAKREKLLLIQLSATTDELSTETMYSADPPPITNEDVLAPTAIENSVGAEVNNGMPVPIVTAIPTLLPALSVTVI